MKANKKGEILIRYWDNGIANAKINFPELSYIHNQKMLYTKKNLYEIIETIMSKGYSCLLRPYTVLGLTTDTDYLTVYIGTGRMF